MKRNSGRTDDALAAEVGDELPLRGERRRSPTALVGVAREPAGPRDAVGEGERAEHDEHPLAGCNRRASAADEPTPAGSVDARRLGSASSARRREQDGCNRDRGNRGDRRGFTPPHRRPVAADRRAAATKRAAEAIIAALSVQSASGAALASGSAARSSELAATPPTIAICSAPICGGGLARALDERADDRALVRGRKVGAPLLDVGRSRTAYRSAVFTPENEKSSPGTLATGKSYAPASPSSGEAIDRSAAGVAQAEQPSALVERLAGCVVERRAEHAEARMIPDVEQQRVPSAREQAEKRRLDGIRLEVERGDVPVQMVDRYERQPAAPGEPLGGREPDEQRADEPRPLRDRDPVDLVQRGPPASASLTTGETSSRCRREAISGTTPP